MSKVAMYRQTNAAVLSSRVSAAVLLSRISVAGCPFPLIVSVSQAWSHCWHTCSMEEMEWGRDRMIGACGGSNSTQYEWPAEPAVPATLAATFTPKYVCTYIHTIQTNLTLSARVWGSFTLTQKSKESLICSAYCSWFDVNLAYSFWTGSFERGGHAYSVCDLMSDAYSSQRWQVCKLIEVSIQHPCSFRDQFTNVLAQSHFVLVALATCILVEECYVSIA